MKLRSELLPLIILLCGMGNVCSGRDRNNTKAAKRYGDERARGRSISSRLEVVPTYTFEYRSPNRKDIKFTSGGIYMASVLENTDVGVQVKCDLKMGVYAHDEKSEVQFIISGGNEQGAFRVSAKKVKDFFFMYITTTNVQLNRESTDHYLLTVEAQDPRTRRTLDQTEVNVSVLDANDNRPIFFNATQFLTVDEDIPLHTSVAKVIATDADIGPNGWLYFTFKEKMSTFSMDPVSGVVTVTRRLNTARRKIYQLRVVVKDRSLPPSEPASSKNHNIVITVKPVNRYSPKIKIKSQLEKIVEGTSGMEFAKIQVTDKDHSESGEISKVRISSGNQDGFFSIKRSNDAENEFVINVVKPLDREKTASDFQLALVAFDKGVPPRSATATLQVHVGDVNDMKPAFGRNAYVARISELAPPHSSVIQVTAEDGDLGKSGEFYYMLYSGSNMFEIDAVTGLVTTKDFLDFETQPRFELEVAAVDGVANSRQMATVKVSVEVEDANDHDPVFEHSSIKIELYEDLMPRTKVLTVKAMDKDTGQNGEIQYVIANPEPVPFAIDSKTGEVRTLTALDRETGLQEYITLKIRASDFGQPLRRESETFVHIRIRALNDNPPVFKQYRCNIQIAQSAPVGTEITTLTAVDIDIGERNALEYRIETVGNTGNTFEVELDTGVLKTAKPFSASTRSFSLHVTVTDGIQQSKYPVALKVKVVLSKFSNFVKTECTDFPDFYKALLRIQEQGNYRLSQVSNDQPPPKPKNNFYPVFEAHRSQLNVSEDVAVGSTLVKFTAKDKDQGYNGMVLYSIVSGNVGSIFNINMLTGDLSVMTPLDRETTVDYTLNISAIDCGQERKVAFTSIKITVLDVNDNSPVFEQESYEVKLLENITSGQTVVVVKATDADDAENGRVSYMLVNDFGGKFRIDSTSGRLSVASSLDYEEVTKFDIEVQAMDGSKAFERMTAAMVHVKLIDINDNAPTIVPSTFSVSIPEDLPIESAIATIYVSDPDTGNGGKLLFSLINSAKKFKIDSETGVLRLRRKVDYEQQNLYNVTVSVSDQGVPSLVSLAVVTVNIVDVNENSVAPRFEEGDLLKTAVYENLPAGTTVVRLKATDDDSWYVKYAIIDGTGVDKFNIDPDTGAITTLKVLNREHEAHDWLTVQAKDGEVYPLHTNIPVLISILDKDDEPPYFNPPVYYPSVRENMKSGESVVTLLAHDPNSDGSNLVYSITKGNKGNKFALDARTGLITTNASLDREEEDTYTLTVSVSNGRTPPKVASITFAITVTDDNDNEPYFLETSYYSSILEQKGSSNPTDIFRVIAVDQDVGTNADLTYHIASGNEFGILSINPKTGVISCKQPLRDGDIFDLVVNVTDGGVPQKFADTSVSLDVVSKNLRSSASPQFAKKVYNGFVQEDAEIGFMVQYVYADDADYDLVSFSIIAGDDDKKFHIDREHGEITVAGNLDREKQGFYNLTVAASDDYNVGTALVNIEVMDVNDNPPRSAMTEYQAHVSEDARPGTRVITVEAKDPDKGLRGEVVYAIVGSVKPKSKPLFKIQSTTGKIKTTKPLDYEDMSEHILIVKASDQGIPKRESLFSVVISVDDVNDHKPVFLRPLYQAEVNVDTAPTTSILKVFASDGDDGMNALLKYSIKSGNPDDAFYIDQNSGMIQVATKLSSTIKEYSLQVGVSDSGIPPETASTEVKVLVKGIKKPLGFERQLYESSIAENTRSGLAIVNVVFNGSLPSYELLPQEDPCWTKFDVNRQSGVVTNKVPFDAEELKECQLIIRANSSDGRWDETQVFIKILDKNDNPPKFTHARYVGYVTEGLAVDSPVIGGDGKPLVVQATDADVTRTRLFYEVVGSSAFAINHESGALLTAEVLDFEAFTSYKFKVKVSDGGIPSLAVFADVEVFVQDVNDLAPVFASYVYSTLLYLPAFTGTEVVKVSAVDGDSAALTKLAYSVVAPPLRLAQMLDISSDLGVITVKNSSFLQEATYNFKVAVSDGNFTDYATVNIDCKPLPDSQLKFSQKNYSASVVEGISSAKEIAAVRAVGYSVGETVSYSIVTPSDFFVISESTGALSTVAGKEFDRETVDRYEVVVQARDGRLLPRVAQTVVYVAVEDVNDNKPEFTEESYFFVVQVGRDLGSFVGQVKAVDKDIGSNGAIKYVLLDGDEGRFRVEHDTGVIKVRRLLDDVVVPRVYTLEIEAHDKGRARLRATAVVKLKVVDKETPIFDQLSYVNVVAENVKVGAEITRVQARSPGGSGIFYTITEGDPLNQFSTDLKTGVVTVVAPLDYETYTQYQLTVRATDAKTTSFGEINVEVAVSDVNDVPPIFNQSLYLGEISEDAPLGTSVISVRAFDGDSGSNQDLTYRLETLGLNINNSKVSEFFTINQTNSVISVRRKLDYESHVVHELKVIATDGGTPSMTGEARVRVVVVDANDNPPRFEQDNYATSISGSAEPGFFVTRVVATDPDESDAGNLRYTITSGEGREHFQVDPRSGVITIARMIGLERGKVYDLGVHVTDGKSTAETSVRVVIGDTNDHSPVFEQETYTVNFQENYPEGTFVTMVTATDEDSGDYARVSYSIDSLEAAEKFTVDADTGMIYSKLPFDREDVSHAFTSIPIRATDGGGRFGFCTVEVRILDENDNQPIFELPRYEVTVSLTTPVGSAVLVASATDEDSGSNSDLTYAILGHQTPPVFEIEVDSGVIKVAQQPEEKTYRFFVLVKDGGNPQLRSMVSVSVNVLRRGAKILQFTRPEYEVSLPEDTDVDFVVTTVGTLYPGSVRPQVQFKIVPGNSPSSRGENFGIDSSGQIRLKSALDYEAMKRYVSIIEANASSIAQVARTVVVVRVKDVNDNKPHFVANPYRVSVPENIKVGSRLLRVFAEDMDDKENGEVLYEFTEDSKFFAVDQQTGWITTVAELDRELSSSLTLSVRATDRGKVTQLSGHTSVQVTVLDVNDSPPKFSSNLFEFSIREDALIGQEVGTLTASDEDLNSAIFFFIMSGDPQAKFGIEQKTGKVFVHSTLDRETVAFYKLNMSVSDGLFTSFATLNVTVLDANDNPPVCSQSISIVHLSEDVKPGSEVLVVEATDSDAEDDGMLKYSVFGQGIGVFKVENDTGRLVTVTWLDRETQDMYNFMVSAEDRGGQACFSNITVLVDDVNDNAPVFAQSQYVTSVYEDSRVNKVLLQVNADDDDIGKNRKMSYSLLDTAAGTFGIDAETGIITLEKALNREKQAEYRLTVEARDEGQPPMKDTCAVVIKVLNINDVPPEFLESSYKANISEDAQKGVTVATLTAVSLEAGQEELSYAILAGPDSDMFKIDSKTGEITLEGTLDYEQRKSYSLTIQASDSGPPVLTTTATLTVVVTDANDQTPTFAKSVYTARVEENAQVNTFVLQPFATDQDSGSNRDIRYSIVKGNEALKFKIDPMTGIISVAAPIDYETTPTFSLTVRAQDHGHPPLDSETEVQVSIVDLNDNPPEFTNTNFTATIGENAVNGATIVYLRPHDRDGTGNGGPFTFMRIMGDQTKFRLNADGLITKAGTLDHKDGPHAFKIRVFDSGNPPRYTDKTVTIIVVESVTHVPVVEPLTVYLYLYGSQFNGGVIGSVKGTDRDGDRLMYSFVAPVGESPFTITTDGLISATSQILGRTYSLNVSVSDGKYLTYSPVQVVVSDITPDILVHSLTLRLSDLGPGTFVEKHLAKCRGYLGNLMKIPAMNVHIWSLQSSGTSLDVVFALKKRLKGFFDSQHIANKLNATRGDFERTVQARVEYIGVSQCRLMQCSDNYQCEAVYKPENKQIRVMSDRTTYISYEHSRSHACMCDREGGCVSPIGKCASSPCPAGYECSDFAQGYQCTCVDSSKCDLDEPGCEDTSCITGDKSITFNGNAYIRYRLKEAFDQPSRSISLALKTTEPQGTLVFAAGQYDYSILEIVNGRLELRFDFGSGAGLVSLDWARVDDGVWHHVAVKRQGNHATLILDQGRHRASNQSPGKMRILNLDDNSIYFGAKVVGSKSRRDVGSQGQRVENGFKGCLQNLNLNGEDLPMSGVNSHVTAEPHNAQPGKCVSSGLCVSSPCQNGGVCTPSASNGFNCACPVGVLGDVCQQDTRPCASNPCFFNANCTNLDDGYECHCTGGLSGKRCEEGYHCNRSPCKNGGSCEEKDAGNCICPPGYQGVDCSNDVDECASSPCQNGGECKNTIGGFICNCTASTHGGKLCDQVLSNVKSRQGWPLGQNEIIGISVVIVVLLLIVFLVVIFLRRRAKRRRDQQAQPGAAKGLVLKVSPPVVGSDPSSPEPPTPPPREIHGYTVDELCMPPGYDSEDSWRRRERARKDFGTMKTLNSSDNNLPGYHWDYTDIPADLVPGGSLTKRHSTSDIGVPDGASFVPEVPQRPSSLRSSQGSLDVPEVPKRPRNYKVSESEDGSPEVPHIPRKPVEYLNTKGKTPSRYSMDSRFSEFSDATDLDPDIFKGRFPRPPREPYPESLDQHPVGSYAPTLLTMRESELGSVTDGIYSEDDLEQVYLGNRMETCDDSPENSYLHSENCSEDEDEDDDDYACGKDACQPEDVEFHQDFQRQIREMMNDLEDLKMESEL